MSRRVLRPHPARDAILDPDRLLTTAEATHLLGLDGAPQVILGWIARDLIPYVKLPCDTGHAHYRIPRAALLSMLGGNGQVATEFKAVVAALAARRGEGRARDDVGRAGSLMPWRRRWAVIRRLYGRR
jgi:hypothetical protein